MKHLRRALPAALAFAAACSSGQAPQTAPTPDAPRPDVSARADTVKPPRRTGTATSGGASPSKPATARAQPTSPSSAAASPSTGAAASRATPKAGAAARRRAVVRLAGGRLARASARNDTLPSRSLNGPVRVCAGGDVTLGTNLDREWARSARARMQALGESDEPSALLMPLREIVRDADVVLLNVESAIGAGQAPSKCGKQSTSCFAFRAPTSSAVALRGVAPKRAVVGNVANNHARDAGDAGRDTTVSLLTRAGVLVTGADTLATAVPTPGGDTIGVLGFYTSNDTPDARDTAAVYRHVARAKQRFPVVIATMHLGAEGITAQHTFDTQEVFLRIDRGNPVAFADAAVRGGAALVAGHGPHVVRGMEWRERGALVAYSLGNLLTYGPFRLKDPMDRGGVLCATIDESGRVSTASFASTFQRAAGLVARDTSARAAWLVDSLTRLDFSSTGARVDAASGVIRPRTGVR